MRNIKDICWHLIYKILGAKAAMAILYRHIFHKSLNWKYPQDLIEKISWLQLYTDTTLWTRCADKFAVRNYVKEKGCEHILNELYGKWDRVDDINWDLLPNSFVLKSNNGCGQVLCIKDKTRMNINEITSILKMWLTQKYGYYGGDSHYLRIKPCIIAEKLLINDKDPNQSLIDYKVWCFHGKPECVLIVSNRFEESYSLSTYDLTWNNISNKVFNQKSPHYSGADFPKPRSFDQMLDVARKLSSGIPQVRIDLYESHGNVIFGEMTFTTGYGYFTKEYYEYLGSKIDLSKVKKLDKINK